MGQCCSQREPIYLNIDLKKIINDKSNEPNKEIFSKSNNLQLSNNNFLKIKSNISSDNVDVPCGIDISSTKNIAKKLENDKMNKTNEKPNEIMELNKVDPLKDSSVKQTKSLNLEIIKKELEIISSSGIKSSLRSSDRKEKSNENKHCEFTNLSPMGNNIIVNIDSINKYYCSSGYNDKIKLMKTTNLTNNLEKGIVEVIDKNVVEVIEKNFSNNVFSSDSINIKFNLENNSTVTILNKEILGSKNHTQIQIVNDKSYISSESEKDNNSECLIAYCQNNDSYSSDLDHEGNYNQFENNKNNNDYQPQNLLTESSSESSIVQINNKNLLETVVTENNENLNQSNKNLLFFSFTDDLKEIKENSFYEKKISKNNNHQKLLNINYDENDILKFSKELFKKRNSIIKETNNLNIVIKKKNSKTFNNYQNKFNLNEKSLYFKYGIEKKKYQIPFYRTISFCLDKTDFFHHKFFINPKITKNNKSIKDYYKIISRLGKGSFGTVFKVQHLQSKILRAMKIIKRESINIQDDERTFLNEIQILKELDHINIIKIFEYFEDSKHFYIINELVDGYELYYALSNWENLNEAMIKVIFNQIMSGVKYMHGKGVIHRDLKPENILVNKMSKQELNNFEVFKSKVQIKLIDFGTSNYYSKKRKMKLVIGSPYYIAPEVLHANYNEKCDIWSCGCILYFLLVGYPPFDGETKEQLIKKIKTQQVDTNNSDWEKISNLAKDLVCKMLERNVDKRISAENLLKHPWFNDVKKKSIFEKNLVLIENKDKTKDSVLNSMKNFYKIDKLQQATIAYITYFLCPQEDIENLRSLFKELDTNKDGELSLEEIEKGFENCFGAVSDSFNMNDLLKDMDTNHDGKISYQEFIRVVIKKNKLINEENLRLCFNQFDENNDGKLSANEIKIALGTNEYEYINALINVIDENNNNEIDFDEFKNLMNRVLKVEVQQNY